MHFKAILNKCCIGEGNFKTNNFGLENIPIDNCYSFELDIGLELDLVVNPIR